MSSSPEEIAQWWKENAVAAEFQKLVQLHIDDSDAMVHRCLETAELEQAAMWNVKKTCFKDILELPLQMIEDAKEARDDDA